MKEKHCVLCRFAKQQDQNIRCTRFPPTAVVLHRRRVSVEDRGFFNEEVVHDHFEEHSFYPPILDVPCGEFSVKEDL